MKTVMAVFAAGAYIRAGICCRTCRKYCHGTCRKYHSCGDCCENVFFAFHRILRFCAAFLCISDFAQAARNCKSPDCSCRSHFGLLLLFGFLRSGGPDGLRFILSTAYSGIMAKVCFFLFLFVIKLKQSHAVKNKKGTQKTKLRAIFRLIRESDLCQSPFRLLWGCDQNSRKQL